MKTSEYWILHDVPQPLLAIGIFILLLVGSALGNVCWSRVEARGKISDLSGGQEQQIAGAVIGLLALLLGFTFSMAVDRYDSRRGLVSQEANAISATYYLAQTFGEPHRSRIGATLIDYVDNRLALATAPDRETARPLLAQTEALQRRLWRESLFAVRGNRDDISSTYLGSAVDIIDVGAARVVSRQSHIPRRVMIALLVYMFVSAMVLGYAFAGPSRYLANGTLFALLTLSMILIIDLDRPVGGRIIELQNAMKALQLRLKAIRPETFSVSAPDVPVSPGARVQ